MLKRVLVLAMVAGGMVLAGCGDDGAGKSSAGRVAVVDLNKIAADAGQADKIQEASKVRENNLQASARGLAIKTQAELNALVEKVGKQPEIKGDKPTDEEKKALGKWYAQRRRLEQMRLEASRKLNQLVYRQRQMNQQAVRAEMTKIRDRIKPLAQRIATDKGFDIVIMTPAVLTCNEAAVDITEAVFAEVNQLLKAGEFPTVTIPKIVPMPVVPTATTQPATDAVKKAP